MSEVHPITFRLKVFNAWRRGNDAPQPDPKTVGEDIDSICDIAKRLERERDEALEECAKWHGMAIEADKRFIESVLFAAAPEMLDALREMLSMFGDHEQYDDDSAQVIAQTRQVIVKAEGRDA